MPDFGGAPVATAIQGPQAGLQTLSALMGLKQQQLGIARAQIGLQQQAQQLSSETSAATVAAINAKQTQALRDIDWSQWNRPDGSYDLEGATQAALRAAPNIGPQFVSNLADMESKGAAAKKAFFGLEQQYQEPIRAAFGVWGADDKSQLSDLTAQLQAVEEDAPAAQQKNIEQIAKNTLGLMTGPNPITNQPRSLREQKAMALAYARAGLAPSEVGGPGGVASKQPTMVNKGGAIVPGAVAPAASGTPGAFTSQGKSIATTLPPQIAKQPGTEGLAVVGGAAGTTPRPLGASEATSAGKASGSTNWWSPEPGQVQLLHANTAALAARIQAGEQAANSSPTAIDALSRARSILDQGTWTGGTFSLTKDLRNLLAGVGVDTGTAQNASELAKNLARYEAARAGSVGDTDAARSLYEAGAPNTKMDARAVKAVVMQSLGIEKMIQGYARVVGDAPTPQVAMQREQAFRSIPHLVQAYELGFMRSKAEADAFFSRYGVTGRDLAKSATELRKLGAL